MRTKSTVEHLEYRGGYSLVQEGEILAIITAYREGKVKKDALRVFAATLEHKALHPKSTVGLQRILNAKASKTGIKHLRSGAVVIVNEQLREIRSAGAGETKRLRAVSRVGLRAVAQGRLNCTEAIVFFMYSIRRISQRKPLRRLLAGERYARFTYGDLSDLSGIPKANICRAVKALKREGLLNTVWVALQNVNQFGLLFVDGPLLTLIPGAGSRRGGPESKKTTTRPAQIDNTSLIELPTLINPDPKSVTKKIKPGFENFVEKGGQGFSSDWYRILERAQAMRESQMEQAA